MFVLYNFLLTVLSPLWVPWMWWRTRQRKEDVDWNQRQGKYGLPPRGDKRRIWIHAVSVGETMAALPVLRELRSILPTHEIVLSVTTSSGHQTARERAAGLYDHLVYFPIDVARFQLGAMQNVRPDVVAIMETELWMNFLWAAKTFDAGTLLINGRISDRSFPRSQKLTFFYRALLKDVDRCLMQSPVDAERIIELGALDAEVFGNTKFDQAMEGLEANQAAWRIELGIDPNKPVVVVGSLRAEEFDFFAQAVLPDVQWIVAPRHLEKSDDLENALKGKKLARRTRGEKLGNSSILILDTYGELAEVYSVADVAIVGGGFANLGGQNVIQPLAHGKPLIHGPYMQNFRDVVSMVEKSGAGRTVSTPEELALAVTELTANLAERKRMGEAARALVRQNTGASRRYAEAIAAAAAASQSKQKR